MTNRVVHFEIPFEDGDRARDFYGRVFDWKLLHLTEMDYTLATTGPTDDHAGPSEPGFINGGLFQRAKPYEGPCVMVEVDNLEETLGTITDAGGEVVSERQEIGEMGAAAYFRDPEGNLIGLWENASGA